METSYKYDAIVVLGRGINQNGELPTDPVSRIKKSAELYQQGLAPKLIMSGSWSYRLATAPICTEAAAMKKYAISQGVPEQDILEETDSKDTLGNAYFVKKNFCIPNNWSQLIVVTSEDHLNRTKYIFNKVFGPKYNLHFVIAERVVDAEQYAKEITHEKKSLSILQEWVGEIEDGDDRALWDLMRTKHPGYSSNAKLTTDDLIQMIDERIV